NQLFNWGSLFDVDPPSSADDIPKKSLDYWVRSNEYALKTARRVFDERHLVVCFEHLCRQPREALAELVDFLELDASSEQLERLAAIPELPSSVGRFRHHERGQFSEDQLGRVKALGFPIE
ncbi:MAG: hypothetical protein ACOCV2_02405, partial [Persicimonas sp.]